MKTIGLIGGLGPESTIEYYRLLQATYRERHTDGSQPSIIINSIDMKKLLSLVAASELNDLADYLSDEILKLANAGADFGLIASNTPHIVFDRVARRSVIPLISIVEAACDAAIKLELKKLALFGTKFAMQGDFYPEVFYKNGIELVVPAPTEQDYIHEKYFGELVKGKVLPETLERMLVIVQRMKEQQEIQGLVLGGTELSLIFREPKAAGVPVLDTTRIHVNKALDELLF
jgi:aspartate racemase